MRKIKHLTIHFGYMASMVLLTIIISVLFCHLLVFAFKIHPFSWGEMSLKTLYKHPFLWLLMFTFVGNVIAIKFQDRFRSRENERLGSWICFLSDCFFMLSHALIFAIFYLPMATVVLGTMGLLFGLYFQLTKFWEKLDKKLV